MKSGTATKLALNMITTASMVRTGKTWGNLMVDLRATNAKLVDRAVRIITSQTALSRTEAIELLPRAGQSVKTALVMAIKDVDRPAAEKMLAAQKGRLGAVVGPPR
jgi:N-acetylmuramic acid 6-phosphate etherase